MDATQLFKVNDNNIEIVLFVLTHVSSQGSLLGPLSCHSKPHMKNLGVLFEDLLKLKKQISSVLKSSFYQLK